MDHIYGNDTVYRRRVNITFPENKLTIELVAGELKIELTGALGILDRFCQVFLALGYDHILFA